MRDSFRAGVSHATTVLLLTASLTAPSFAVATPAKPATAKPAAKAAPRPAAGSTVELAYWQSIATSNDIAQFDAYIARYPRGTFAKLAKLKIAALMAQQDAAGTAQVDVAGPIDDAPIATAALPSSGKPAAAAANQTTPVTAPPARAIAQVAQNAPPPPIPSPGTREEEQEGGPEPWPTSGTSAPAVSPSAARQPQEEAQEQGEAAPASAPAAWPSSTGQARSTPPLPPPAAAVPPPEYGQPPEPAPRDSAPGAVRAALPLRPRLAPVRTADLPPGFCSAQSRDDYYREEFLPAAEAAADNNARANAYLRTVQAQYDRYKFNGDATGTRITGQENAAYREIADDAFRASQAFNDIYDQLMRLPVGGCR